jgi:beta-glucosidase
MVPGWTVRIRARRCADRRIRARRPTTITFPADEQNTPILNANQYPGIDGTATYTEEKLVGYRWYQVSGIAPAFPFGHGLGYTTFEITHFQIEQTDKSFQAIVEVRNTGSRAGKAVPQIYISYPPDAGEPPGQLKGFDAIRLEAGETRRTTIKIARDDLLIFDEQSRTRWLPSGPYEFRAALSSQDGGMMVRADVTSGPETGQ